MKNNIPTVKNARLLPTQVHSCCFAISISASSHASQVSTRGSPEFVSSSACGTIISLSDIWKTDVSSILLHSSFPLAFCESGQPLNENCSLLVPD